MDKPMSTLAFNGMSLMFKLRDFLFPRRDILGEAGIGPGFQVLDYGCGPGGYVTDAADLVGESGTVYALDLHPLAIQSVQDLAKKKRLTNVKIIHSDCETGLPDNSLDVVLLYDVFHMLCEPQAVLAELHRVLKPDGLLSLNEPHMTHKDITAGVTRGRLFKLSEKGKKTHSFSPQQNSSCSLWLGCKVTHPV